MTSIYETQKKPAKNPSTIYSFSNKKSCSTNKFDIPRKTYVYQQSNIINRNNMNDSQINLFSEENYPLNYQSPSNASNSEDDLFNSNTKRFQNTHISNGMKKIRNNPYSVSEPIIYPDTFFNLNNLNLNIPKPNNLEYKLHQLNTEMTSINNDNLILKEDIYKYTNMNKYLENEIKIQKEHNNDLIRTNDKLIEENNNLNDKLTNDTNELNDLIQEKDAKKKEYEEKQKKLELDNDKVNKDYDELLNINNKAKNDFNILSQNYDELNAKNNNTKNELCLLKDLENKHFSDIEDKMNSIVQKIEALKKEQNDLNKENNENKNKLDKIKKDKDDLYNKYQQEMVLSDKLNKDLYNNKLNLNAIKTKCKEQKENRNKKVKTRPSSINKKKALIKDLQKKIDDYKIKTLRKSSINDDY